MYFKTKLVSCFGEKRETVEKEKEKRRGRERGDQAKTKRYGTLIFGMDACLCYEFYMDIRDPSMILIQEFLGYDC